MASLHIILSSMYGGKTNSLLREVSSDAAMGLQCLYVNHSLDTRSTTIFSTHNKLLKVEGEIENIKFVKTDRLSTVEVAGFDVVAIDEAQFYEDLYECVCKFVDVDRKKVLVAGLDGNSNRQKFGQILDLIPMSDTVVKLLPYCKRCADAEPKRLVKAPFTHRFVKSADVILVGGSEYYQPVCRSCYLELNS